MAAERTFPVMGSTAHVTVEVPSGAEEIVDRVHDRLDELERRWSRFLAASEVSRVNAAAGRPVLVSTDTLDLFERGVEGWRATAGRFDPTVLPALVAAGYDRSFDAIDRARAPEPGPPAPGCADVFVDRTVGAVRVPPGVAFDPGGVGKGLAADIVVREALGGGAAGVCANVGGDVRVAGEAPGGAGWLVEVDHPLPGHAPLGVLRIADGAVASTWRTKRAWGPDGRSAHHLIDPRTGAPAATGLAGVCVVTARAWWAEVLAKAAFLSGPDDGARLLAAHGAAGFLVLDDGSALAAGALERMVA